MHNFYTVLCQYFLGLYHPYESAKWLQRGVTILSKGTRTITFYFTFSHQTHSWKLSHSLRQHIQCYHTYKCCNTISICDPQRPPHLRHLPTRNPVHVYVMRMWSGTCCTIVHISAVWRDVYRQHFSQVTRLDSSGCYQHVAGRQLPCVPSRCPECLFGNMQYQK